MLITLVLLGFLLSDRISCKICQDCMDYNLCPAARDVITENADSETVNQFLAKFCGVNYVDGDRIPKICCSDFGMMLEVSPLPLPVKHSNHKLLPNSCGFIDVQRVDSRVVSLYEFPWIALLSSKTRHGNKFICDGVIINARYVLTAAACTEALGLSSVRVGDYNPKTPIDCAPESNLSICETHIQDITIQEIQRHPEFVKTPVMKNNIALLRLTEAIDFSFRNVAPICLPIHPELRAYTLLGQTGTTAGWSHDGVYDIRDYGQLIKLQKDVKPTHTCSAALGRLRGVNFSLQANEFCVLSQADALCNTIAGDPFMIINKYNQINRYILYGIFSHGPLECLGNTPEVFIDIAKMVDWILDTIRS